MDKLFELTDKLASGETFTTLEEIVRKFYKQPVEAVSNTSEYKKLKQILNRYKVYLEFKNEKDLKGGFRYKPGFENFFQFMEEEKRMRRMNDDAKKIFVTEGLQALLDGETSSRHLIELETISKLQNLCLVKVLSKYLGKSVISFQYNQGYQNTMQVKVHPHILKEFNSRWFLLGYVVDDRGLPEVVNFSLDRIIYHAKEDIKKEIKIEFLPAPRDFYKQYFKDIIGVTKNKDKPVETIYFRSTNFKVHNLLVTKPLHSSQVETMPFDEKAGEGEFSVEVIPNVELRSKLLSFGEGIYVLGDGDFQKEFKNVVAKMQRYYSAQ